MIEELAKIISVVFISSFKFVAGPPLAYAYDFSYVETIVLTVAGGMAGVLIISYYTPALVRFWKWLVSRWNALFSREEERHELFSQPVADVEGPVDVQYVYVPKKPGKKLFSKRNRRLISIWKRYGLFGIALITPVTISIPIGTFIATRLVPNKKKVLVYMFVSVVFWSILLSSIFEIYQVVNLSQLESLFFE